jgi:hypothetical protein
MKFPLLPFALAAALTACSPAAVEKAPAETAETVAPAPATETQVTGSAGEMDVGFELGFTEYARMRLGELGEKVTVSAMYYGQPTPEAEAAMTEADGPVYVVGTYEVTVDPVDQTINVSGGDVDAAKLANLAGAPKLNVNVYTARTKHPDNIITCTLIDEEVGELRAKPPATLCEMLDAN